MVDMTLNDLLIKVKVIQFGTNRFLIYDFLQAVNSNFCSRAHRLATIHSIQTDDDDEGRNTVPIARPLIRSAKNRTL